MLWWVAGRYWTYKPHKPSLAGWREDNKASSSPLSPKYHPYSSTPNYKPDAAKAQRSGLPDWSKLTSHVWVGLLIEVLLSWSEAYRGGLTRVTLSWVVEAGSIYRDGQTETITYMRMCRRSAWQIAVGHIVNIFLPLSFSCADTRATVRTRV